MGIDFYYCLASLVGDVRDAMAGEPLAEWRGIGGIMADYEFFGGSDYYEVYAA